jgi:hypothetical protein
MEFFIDSLFDTIKRKFKKLPKEFHSGQKLKYLLINCKNDDMLLTVFKESNILFENVEITNSKNSRFKFKAEKFYFTKDDTIPMFQILEPIPSDTYYYFDYNDILEYII